MTTTSTLAQTIFTELSADAGIGTITLPDYSGGEYAAPGSAGNPLYTAISKLSDDDLTEGTVDGNGTFDVLMKAFKAHLTEEFEGGRITGDQYTKAYIELTAAAMGNAVQFTLGKEQAYWQAVLVQNQAKRAEVDAVTARVQLETAKTQGETIFAQLKTALAQYSLTKMQIGVAETDVLVKQSQKAQMDYQVSDVLPAQKKLLEEQTEVQRAQTLDTRTDGASIEGSVGKQKDLYDQQITSYQRDSEYKAAKMFLDAWITQKTLDEGLTAPNELTNATLETVLGKIRASNDLD